MEILEEARLIRRPRDDCYCLVFWVSIVEIKRTNIVLALLGKNYNGHLKMLGILRARDLKVLVFSKSLLSPCPPTSTPTLTTSRVDFLRK